MLTQQRFLVVEDAQDGSLPKRRALAAQRTRCVERDTLPKRKQDTLTPAGSERSVQEPTALARDELVSDELFQTRPRRTHRAPVTVNASTPNSTPVTTAWSTVRLRQARATKDPATKPAAHRDESS